MADATVNGCRLWYDLRGEGTHLLQIGGAGFAHENFGFVTDGMAKAFTVIDFDLRGYGLSERPEQPYSMDVWADDAAALLEAIGVEQAHVHGTSMGGIVAIRLAAKHPERVYGLVLDCTAAKSDFMSAARSRSGRRWLARTAWGAASSLWSLPRKPSRAGSSIHRAGLRWSTRSSRCSSGTARSTSSARRSTR
ncbi:MAG: alpha/beta fold hydrolase [Actinomycetia bacterium]|nr:alpha/beta fold hydrolase [Actinomycetes bacterium]